MYHIHTEMSNGAVSVGYNIEDEATARRWFDGIVKSLTEMGFVGDVVLSDLGIDMKRETIHAA